MTLKMVAIGILALMGLSSVMSPKTFRVFLGGLGALCMALFWGLVVMGNHGDEESKKRPVVIAKIQELLGLQKDWMESATTKSNAILKNFKEGRRIEDPTLRDLVVEERGVVRQLKNKPRFPNAFARPIEPENDDITANLQAQIGEYLGYFKKHNPGDVGVHLLTYKDLSPDLLKAGLVQHKVHGPMLLSYFSDDYASYVRLRGRQVLMKQRLIRLCYYAGAVSAVLMLAYAGLKIFNRRSEPLHDRDYLRHSDISLV